MSVKGLSLFRTDIILPLDTKVELYNSRGKIVTLIVGKIKRNRVLYDLLWYPIEYDKKGNAIVYDIIEDEWTSDNSDYSD